MVVRGDEMWRALASPARSEMVTLLEAMRVASVGDLAHAMGRPADRLYHHMRVLVESGLVSHAGARGEGRQSEAVYQLAARTMKVSDDPEEVPGMMRGVRALVGSVLRAMEEALESGLACRKGKHANTIAAIETAWLTDDEAAEAKDLIMELQGVFAAAQGRTSGKRFSLAVAWTPVDTKNGERA